jgi:hypothetical protein
MYQFIKFNFKKIAFIIIALFLTIQLIDYFDKPTPNKLPYSAQPGCDIVNDPEFQKGIKRAHYIPTSEERPDLYLQGGDIQKTKDSVNQ